MMRSRLLRVVTTIGVLSAVTAAAAVTPTFADYPAASVFKGTPAAPKLVTPQARMFRTELRRQAATGPNFAAHFTLALWGCGAGCVYVAVIDAISGDVFFPSIQFEDKMNASHGVVCHHASDFEPTSELFIAQGDLGGKVGRHYFRWQNGRFTPVHFDRTCL